MLLSDTPFALDKKPLHRERSAPVAPAPIATPTRSGTHRASASLAERVRIEPARLGDWDSICAMVARNFPRETERNLGYWLCHQLPYFRVARLDGKVVAFLHAQPRRDSGTLWVNMLAVDERFRGQGIAHRMVEHFDSVCRDWGCQHIGLQCLTSNVPAIHLYERHGYACLHEATTELGLQVLVHRKSLPVSAAPASSPRPPVALDSRPLCTLYRLYYLAWFRRRSPMPR